MYLIFDTNFYTNVDYLSTCLLGTFLIFKVCHWKNHKPTKYFNYQAFTSKCIYLLFSIYQYSYNTF